MPTSDALHHDKVLIVDFGSQYTQLIARVVRSLGVYCEIHPFDMHEEAIRDFAPKAIVLSGGPESVTQAGSPRAPEVVFGMGCPVLGVCYGMQTMAVQLGGEVTAGGHSEFGHMDLSFESDALLMKRVTAKGGRTSVWMSHGDQLARLPEGFKVMATSDNTPIAAMADESRHLYGLQFHPEVTHTPEGKHILSSFLFDVAKCQALWKPAQIIESTVSSIQAQVGDEQVILGLSGGVDSAVAAVLIQKAIGNRLHCIFVDTGLLRNEEGHEVKRVFEDHFNVDLHCVDAKDRFYKALEGVADPEEKRRIIGHLFVEVFDEEAAKLSGIQWLAQGTIYPDVIESACSDTQKAHVIKTHHNVGGLPEQMQLKVLEPLRELFKDEVRAIGLQMGLPADWINRHPFPGPGLAVRILGEVSAEVVTTLQRADAIFMEALHASGWYEQVSQAFAVFLPVKSVGVMGDGRVYAPVIALRAVQTVDFMTAEWAPLPHDLLAGIARRIVNEVPGVSRVVYDISGKPPATIEWE